MKILSLNTQKGYQENFKDFLIDILKSERYDFLLLQEVSDKVADIITDVNSLYNILRPYDTELAGYAHVCILYKSTYMLHDNSFISFANFNPKMPPKGWGCLTAIFDQAGKKLQLSSIHLHSGTNAKVRLKELEIIKNTLDSRHPSFIVGDFNTGLPGELVRQEKMLYPEFMRVSKNIGVTLDSRYTENAPFLLNRISIFLSKLHIGFRFKADHAYTNRRLLGEYSIDCQTLKERVSDHLAVEIVTSRL